MPTRRKRTRCLLGGAVAALVLGLNVQVPQPALAPLEPPETGALDRSRFVVVDFRLAPRAANGRLHLVDGGLCRVALALELVDRELHLVARAAAKDLLFGRLLDKELPRDRLGVQCDDLGRRDVERDEGVDREVEPALVEERECVERGETTK